VGHDDPGLNFDGAAAFRQKTKGEPSATPGTVFDAVGRIADCGYSGCERWRSRVGQSTNTRDRSQDQAKPPNKRRDTRSALGSDWKKDAHGRSQSKQTACYKSPLVHPDLSPIWQTLAMIVHGQSVPAGMTGITETTPSAFGVERSNRRSFVALLLRMTAREIVYFCLHSLAFSALWAFCAF